MMFFRFLVLFVAYAAVFASDEDEAYKYLQTFHYISPTRSGNHDFKTAVRNFQHFMSLPVTGKVDSATLNMMRKPRCGVPDVEDGTFKSRKRRFSVFGSKWSKTHLTYYLKHGQDLPRATQEQVIKRALQYWSEVSPLTFSRSYDPSRADLKMSFGPGSHEGTEAENTCGYPFDGEGGVLAHAFAPSDGRLHFDEAEKFTDLTDEGTNLLYVAVHEIGHNLGLRHSSVRDAVMYPSYLGYKPDLKLHSDDIAGIQSLYGSGSGELLATSAKQLSMMRKLKESNGSEKDLEES
ncbi:hypothetical protein ACROYT_G023097 [Oculina patagonica]